MQQSEHEKQFHAKIDTRNTKYIYILKTHTYMIGDVNDFQQIFIKLFL